MCVPVPGPMETRELGVALCACVYVQPTEHMSSQVWATTSSARLQPQVSVL